MVRKAYKFYRYQNTWIIMIQKEGEARVPAVFIVGVLLAVALAGIAETSSFSGYATKRPTATAAQQQMTVEV